VQLGELKVVLEENRPGLGIEPTKLQVFSPAAGVARLTVYDLAGGRVATDRYKLSPVIRVVADQVFGTIAGTITLSLR
jgi:hypothetical protein